MKFNLSTMDNCFNGSFVRFLVVGGFSTIIQFTVLIVLVELFFIDLILASIFSYLFSALVNYLLNYYFTFLSVSKHFRAIVKFGFVVIIGCTVNASLFTLGLKVTDFYLVAQCMATLVALIVNYILHKSWTYK